jgi:hypothetical protein
MVHFENNFLECGFTFSNITINKLGKTIHISFKLTLNLQYTPFVPQKDKNVPKFFSRRQK